MVDALCSSQRTALGSDAASAEAGEPSRKQHRAGTHRLVPPEETVARIRPFMPLLGITRIADVTGLDTLGIPVMMACRPNARSLSVSQGKGLTLAAARASALMESVEHYHAEHITLPLKLGTVNELRFTHNLCDVGGLPRLSVTAFHENLRLFWVEGVNVVEGTPTWVPFELVHTDYSLPILAGSGSFLMSSSGLASGNHRLEAISHALCELVERDAVTLWRLAGQEHQQGTRVDLSTVDDPGCREVLTRYERAGISVFVWEITSDIGIAAFSCTIVDGDPDPSRPIGPMGGFGCHPSRGVALLRALTEAAQSRLTLITGARDDVRFGMGTLEEDLAAARRCLAEHGAAPARRGFRVAPDHAGETFAEDVRWELDRLRSRGLHEVIAVDLTKAELGIPVVRVLVPGLEPLHDVSSVVPGARARRLLRESMS
jgi:ribosomal protein S12 methylthiotransferase accessory factor